MIKVESITIREFRGIRDLTLDLKSQNYAICGPNGTGKSGIVDALEFALTGNVSRLTGSGTGGLSIKEHGPHVDSRNNPEKASVSLLISIPSLRKTVTIERTVKDAKNPTITPDEESIKNVIEQVLLHPEFTLSRREIIQYVLSEPGKRAKEIQTLLRLSEIETVRTTLQKITNIEEKSIQILESAQKQVLEQLARAFNITQLTPEKLLTAVNGQRSILSLPSLTALEATTSIKDGLSSLSETTSKHQVPKNQAGSDLKSLRKLLEHSNSDEFQLAYNIAKESVSELENDAANLDGVTRQELLQTALKVFDDQSCPICGTTWEPDKFRAVIDEKLKHFEEVAARRSKTEELLEPIASYYTQLSSALALVAKYGPLLATPVEIKALQDYAVTLTTAATQLQKLLPLSDTLSALPSPSSIQSDILSAIDSLEKGVFAIPEPSQQDAAREMLTVGQERLENYRQAKLKVHLAKEKAVTVRTVFDLYGAVTTDALETIYKQVEQKFSALYRIINHEDEDKFEAQLLPSTGKLGFDVDFYGRGYFPPGAYHSEGHQDGMGLCLYLALMSHLLGEHFTFAVLDDVLMSVDAGHRREVSRLLREQFPSTQFILTTHDEIWLRHMKSQGLIQPKACAHFRTWNVDNGPTEWDDRDVWEEINVLLSQNNVQQSSALLRHYLEHLSHDICHHLRAPVEFRGDAQFSLGDLLPSAISTMGRLLRSGKAAAQSWGQNEIFQVIHAMETNFSSTATLSNVEQWQINAAVHYNQWVNLQKTDFEPVVIAFQELALKFQCPQCHSLLSVVPEHGQKQALRCKCSNININLQSKS